MFKKALLGLGTLALAVASAADGYRFTLLEKSTLNGTELKPGDYKIQIDGGKATLRSGKTVAQANVKVENVEQKISSTSVKYVNGTVQEIRLGGTKTKLIFEN